MRNVVNNDDRLYISKFICSVCDFACDGYEKFYNHMLIMHKKTYIVADAPTVLSGLNPKMGCETIAKPNIWMF